MTKTKKLISYEELCEKLVYDPLTGLFTWKVSPNKGIYPGDIAGSVSKRGYVYISFKRQYYKAHRLAYLYMTGNEPEEYIDHIDGDCSNNSWGNLRPVSMSENMKNRKLGINNTSGYPGVYRPTGRKKWLAWVRIDGKTVSLGSFENLEDAIEARKAAESENGYHINNGRVMNKEVKDV